MKRLATLILVVAALAALGGCTGRVVRTITVDSEPPGALVWLNDNEVGRTPLTVPFTWYGVYRVRLEKDGYATLTAFERVAAPWYEWPPIDLATETVVPGTRRDEHHFPTYVLTVAKPANPDDLLNRAKDFRKESEESFQAETK